MVRRPRRRRFSVRQHDGQDTAAQSGRPMTGGQASPDGPHKRREGWRQSIGQTACFIAVITLVVLKLTGVINWSWWWVLSPVWAPLALNMLPITVLLVMMVMHWASRSRDLMSRHGARSQEPGALILSTAPPGSAVAPAGVGGPGPKGDGSVNGAAGARAART